MEPTTKDQAPNVHYLAFRASCLSADRSDGPFASFTKRPVLGGWRTIQPPFWVTLLFAFVILVLSRLSTAAALPSRPALLSQSLTMAPNLSVTSATSHPNVFSTTTILANAECRLGGRESSSLRGFEFPGRFCDAKPTTYCKAAHITLGSPLVHSASAELLVSWSAIETINNMTQKLLERLAK